jgi:RsiW-degrading membrane proteinase PrsW (M82 family)
MTTTGAWWRLRRGLLVGFLVLVMGASGLVLLGTVTHDTGVVGFLIGVSLALLPLPVVLAAYRWLDRYEPEPRSVLLFAFFWGATVAALIAAVLNTASLIAIARTGGGSGMDTTAVLVAPWIEEAAKGAAVLLVLLFRRREFDGVVDGIVYAGLSGVGFAFIENVLYLGRSIQDESSRTAFVFFLRCFMSPFSHPLFTAAIGIGLGLAMSTRRPLVRLLAPPAGWLVAVGLHAAWNLSALSGLRGFTTVYVLFQVPVFVCFLLLAMLARQREGRIIAAHLGAYAAAGWLSPGEVEMLHSLRGRRDARAWARSVGGPAARQAMSEFQAVASELAFLRERMVHRAAPPDAAAQEYGMLTTLYALRRAFLSNLPNGGHPLPGG